MEREVKGNEREMKGKWKGNENEGKRKGSEREIKGKWRETKGKRKESEREIKGKLSDPSPFNNLLNNLQFLLAVVGINQAFLSLS
jgi:hypothetical protein